MQIFNKTATKGYLPIYANDTFTRVNLKATVNSMKNLHGFVLVILYRPAE